MDTTAEVNTATARALRLPEILDLILEWVSMDYNFYSPVYPEPEEGDDEDKGEGDDSDSDEYSEQREYLYTINKDGCLSRCAQVNKTWFDLAVPHLWETPGCSGWGSDKTLPKRLAAIAPGRRQVYARHVVRAALVGVDPNDAEAVTEADAAVAGLEFPKLDEVEIMLSGWGCSAYIPRLDGRRVSEVHLDPSFDLYPDTYRVGQDEMAEILKQIPARFPNLRLLQIDDQCLAYPGTAEAFVKRMPSGFVFNSGCMIETEVYPRSTT